MVRVRPRPPGLAVPGEHRRQREHAGPSSPTPFHLHFPALRPSHQLSRHPRSSFSPRLPQIGGAKNSPAKVFAVEVDADGAIIVDTARVGSSGASI